MICTNPDLIVDRGNVTEYCAGSVAKIFEDLGGKVEYFGKPYPPVYQQALDIKNKKYYVLEIILIRISKELIFKILTLC